MKKLKTNLQLKVILPVMGLLIVISTVVVYSEHRIEFGKLHDQHLDDVHKAERLMTEMIHDDSVVYSALMNQICQVTALQQAFIDKDRQALLELTEPLYTELNEKYNVTHFYFHQLDKTCFLRVHNSSRFGDVIERQTLAGAIRQGEPFYGIELGPMGTFALRYVQPWRVDGKLIGYVELGEEIEHIARGLKANLGFEFITTIHKSFINRTDWQKGLHMLGRAGDWDLLDTAVMTGSTFDEVPPAMMKRIQETCLCEEEVCRETPLQVVNDENYIFCCFKLLDAGQRQVGRVFVIQDVSAPATLIAHASMFYGAMIIAAGFCASIFFYFYIGRIECRLEETHKKQKMELLHRRFAEAQLTEAKERAEAAFKEMAQVEQKLQLHVNQTPLGMIRWSTTFTVEGWNPAAEDIFGYSAAEAIGRTANELIVPLDIRESVDEVYDTLLHQTGSSVNQNENVTRDGTRIMCQWHNTPLVDMDGEIIGVSSIVQDVTREIQYEQRLKQAKEQAEAANQAKSRFLANMSHELRTPMNAILGFSDLLKEEALTDEQSDYVDTIHTSSQHLLTLINDVLDISKIEAGKEEITLGACSLRDLLVQLEQLMRNAAQIKGLQFELDIRHDVPEQIITDSKHLYQCLINLVSNAVKFTETGSVTLHVGLLDDETCSFIVFELQDTGIGIPADRQKKVFESFEQADSSTSRKYGGTGLGLAITRQLIEMMGGSVCLESEEGIGSTFTVTVPVERAAQPAAQSAS